MNRIEIAFFYVTIFVVFLVWIYKGKYHLIYPQKGKGALPMLIFLIIINIYTCVIFPKIEYTSSHQVNIYQQLYKQEYTKRL